MTNFYIAAAWIATFGIVGAYAISILVRGRRLAAMVPPERRRWMADRSSGDVGTIGAGPAVFDASRDAGDAGGHDV